MNKEKLLAYFQEHYLSRQEVLFKLPLNYPIDTFWPELLNRRKAQATLLPLYNASGMPYWYVLTPGMVQASERLCEEAINQQTDFDPYRAEMTSAMTEEMFFTSFVEGAQIPLQAAMDFLQRGTEPESIQEQMIWNNRHAWAEMVGAIYRPLDEQFVKSLAYMLTEEMDGCAVDYRQSDTHPIAAMNTEPYEVPPAYCLPDRMNEYYSFLQNGSIHPLVKASAAQAFMLVTRPFPEGNERLSRMISSAVLLRSGYDFFRDISLSSVIARESYRYYKGMCEIIRSENGGDLTYFMEYYLGLLVRALDARNERISRRQQEALAREREMARTPLQAFEPAAAEPPQPPEEKPPKKKRGPRNARGKEPTHVRPAGVKFDPLPIPEFLAVVDKMNGSPHAGNRVIPEKVHRMIDMGEYSFSVSRWAEVNNTERKYADVECRKLYDKGLLDRRIEGGVLVYSFQIITSPEPAPTDPRTPDKPDEEMQESEPDAGQEDQDGTFWEKLERIEESPSENRRTFAKAVRKIYDDGISEFTPATLMEMTGLDKEYVRNQCDRLVNDKMIINTNIGKRTAVYSLAVNRGERPEEEAGKPSPEIIEQARSLGYDSQNDRDQRIGRFLLKMIEKGIDRFTTEDWENEYHVSSSVYGNDLRRAVNLGLVIKHSTASGSNLCFYTISEKLPETIRSEDLTDMQKDYLTRIYSKYPDRDFTVIDIAELLNIKASSANFHLMNFAERDILVLNRQPGRAHQLRFAVNPKDHPECFTGRLPAPAKLLPVHAESKGMAAAAV